MKKILSANPSGKIRRYKNEKSTDQKIWELRKKLNLDQSWEKLKFNLELQKKMTVAGIEQ